jgi:hypothetical protein
MVKDIEKSTIRDENYLTIVSRLSEEDFYNVSPFSPGNLFDLRLEEEMLSTGIGKRSINNKELSREKIDSDLTIKPLSVIYVKVYRCVDLQSMRHIDYDQYFICHAYASLGSYRSTVGKAFEEGTDEILCKMY